MAKVLKIETRETKAGAAKPGDVLVRLIDNEFRNDELPQDHLGVVQSIVWKAKVGEQIRCTVETLMTPAQLEVAAANVDLNVHVQYRDLPVKDLLRLVWYRLTKR